MAEIAWARKYRPRNISEYMGNTLQRIIENRFKDRSNIPQTIFLHGTRGCGKTTGARLLAKEIQCLNPIDGRACNECEMCQEIDQYISSSENGVECMGITEVNAADATGKESITDIIDEVCLEPQYPMKYKVLILDECHMLSKAAQNSLLKPIEEPPAHLVIIFCTTDPQNVIDTIKSRMQLKIEVKKQTVEELSQRLLFVAKQEKLNTSIDALKVIAKKSDRVPREALNMLEDVAKAYGNIVTLETVRDATGEVASEIYIDFFKAANKSLEDIMVFIRNVKEKNISTKDFIAGLTRFILDCLNVKFMVGIEDYPEGFIKQAKAMFAMYKSRDFDTLLQIVEYANKMAYMGDETQGELILANTALRVGKVQLLSNGSLASNLNDAEKENNKSFSLYKTSLAQAQKDTANNIAEMSTTSSDFLGMFGRGLAEIKSANEVPLITEEEKQINKKHIEDKFSLEELQNILNADVL